jgi:hypothetical protein
MDKKTDNALAKRTNTDLQNTTQKKIKIEQQEPRKKPGENWGAREGQVPAPLVAPVVFRFTVK